MSLDPIDYLSGAPILAHATHRSKRDSGYLRRFSWVIASGPSGKPYRGALRFQHLGHEGGSRAPRRRQVDERVRRAGDEHDGRLPVALDRVGAVALGCRVSEPRICLREVGIDAADDVDDRLVGLERVLRLDDEVVWLAAPRVDNAARELGTGVPRDGDRTLTRCRRARCARDRPTTASGAPQARRRSRMRAARDLLVRGLVDGRSVGDPVGQGERVRRKARDAE